jgi:hypothetical protein
MEVRRLYVVAYIQQMRLMMYFCIATLMSSPPPAKKQLRKFETTEDGELVASEQVEQ